MKPFNDQIKIVDATEFEKLKKENENLRKIIAKEIGENDEFGSEFVIASILRAENQKLRQLILLTDPAVSNEQMNTLSAKQWAEFLRWQEAEGYNDKK